MANPWYYTRNGTPKAPVTSAELKRLAELGEISPTDNVWKDGMNDWVPAAKIKGLFATPPPPEPPPIPGPPKRPTPVQIASEVPVQIAPPQEGVLAKVAKGIAIAWSAFCLFGVTTGLFSAARNMEPSHGEHSDAVSTGAILGIAVGMVIWLIFWAVIAVPALVVWLLSRNK